MDYYTPLTVADCELMNAGTRAQGGEGLNIITPAECEDLADFFDVGSLSARRWFRVPRTPGGTLPEYRRLVPIQPRPGDPSDPAAPGRSIYSMFGDVPDADSADSGLVTIQRKTLTNLLYRCLLGACDGDPEGLTRDGVFHGKSFDIHIDYAFLSDALELGVHALIEGHWGSADFGADETEHGVYFMQAWYRIRILYIPPENRTYGAKWRVLVRLNRPHPIIDYPEVR